MSISRPSNYDSKDSHFWYFINVGAYIIFFKGIHKPNGVVGSSTDFSRSWTCKVKQKTRGTNMGFQLLFSYIGVKIKTGAHKHKKKTSIWYCRYFIKKTSKRRSNSITIWELKDQSFAEENKWWSYIKAPEVGSELQRPHLVQRQVWASHQGRKAEVPASWSGTGTKFLQASASIPEPWPYFWSPFLFEGPITIRWEHSARLLPILLGWRISTKSLMPHNVYLQHPAQPWAQSKGSINIYWINYFSELHST